MRSLFANVLRKRKKQPLTASNRPPPEVTPGRNRKYGRPVGDRCPVPCKASDKTASKALIKVFHCPCNRQARKHAIGASPRLDPADFGPLRQARFPAHGPMEHHPAFSDIQIPDTAELMARTPGGACACMDLPLNFGGYRNQVAAREQSLNGRINQLTLRFPLVVHTQQMIGDIVLEEPGTDAAAQNAERRQDIVLKHAETVATTCILAPDPGVIRSSHRRRK